MKTGREGDEHQTEVAPIRMKIQSVIAATKGPKLEGTRQESEMRSVNKLQVQEIRESYEKTKLKIGLRDNQA